MMIGCFHNRQWRLVDRRRNLITDEHLAYYRRIQMKGLIAEFEAGRKHLFGSAKNGDGSARLTVELPRKAQGLWNYLQLVREMYRDWPKALRFITEMPSVADWWVIIQPAIAESFFGISPRYITEVAPVGEETAAYLEAVHAIQEAA
jgi:hypothetical protein